MPRVSALLHALTTDRVPAFAAATGLPPESAEQWLPHIEEAAERFRISTPARLAMFLAQVGHESQGFRRLTENLNYSDAGLCQTWPSRFPTLADAMPYHRQPERIANKVYANRMGNGDEESGDEWRYRGRGLIQLTGRDNYAACAEALGVDLLAYPDLLTDRAYAALSAGWYWQMRGLNPLADAGEIELVSRRINGGEHGLAERAALWKRARLALGVA